MIELPTYADEPATEEGYLTDAQMQHFRDKWEPECCAKCKFWHEYEPPSFYDMLLKCGWAVVSYCGICRRRSPVILSPTPDYNRTEPSSSYWPETEYRDWCGEYEVKR